ncbi:MAG: PilZ domain-containing protein [Gammaproteobacteria bacterium]|nr:PilZ domain-containing protein [Gammaproteobacteria bacterium]
MNTERRWTPRFPISVNISIYYSGLGLISAKTSNLSQRGAYVETGHIRLRLGSHVELILPVSTDPQGNHQRLGARIARIDNRGIGLAFRDAPSEDTESLHRLLSQYPPERVVAG